MRKKDVVLMATVTSFESLPHPSRSELRQFAELFAPLFSASSEEARRQAVAALSQCRTVPPSAAFFIASQPIAISAPFLVASPCLSDDALIAVARMQGEAHARAIVRRESLSPTVIDALVGLRHRPATEDPAEEKPAAEEPAHGAAVAEERQAPAAQAAAEAAEAGRLAREEDLRDRLRRLSAHVSRPASDRLGLRTVSSVQEALLVRFAREREAGLFASVLAETLSASRWLAERIMLDISGRQLAGTLKGIGMSGQNALFILERLYDHLTSVENGASRADILWRLLDEDECARRVEAWRRADRYTYPQLQEDAPQPVRAAETVSMPMRRLG